MKISTGGNQTAERSASDLLQAVKDLLASAAKDQLTILWNVQRSEHIPAGGDGTAIGWTRIEISSQPPCTNCGGVILDDEEGD